MRGYFAATSGSTVAACPANLYGSPEYLFCPSFRPTPPRTPRGALASSSSWSSINFCSCIFVSFQWKSPSCSYYFETFTYLCDGLSAIFQLTISASKWILWVSWRSSPCLFFRFLSASAQGSLNHYQMLSHVHFFHLQILNTEDAGNEGGPA